MTLGMANQKNSKPGNDEPEAILANQSLLLLLVLTNHCYSGSNFENPYHEAFLTCSDSQEATSPSK